MEFITSERKKYVTAREEVEKAKENLKKNSHEDVMNHARTAIDLAIKERFGFKKIPKMKTFIEQADKLSFPLPSYDLIYSYFNEGNERMHEGKIHTTFEGYEVIRTISNFIDALETVQISPQQLQKFVDDCECVKMDSA